MIKNTRVKFLFSLLMMMSFILNCMEVEVDVFAYSKNEKTAQFTTITPEKDILVYDDSSNIIATYKKNQEYIVEQTINKYYMVKHENAFAYVKKENVKVKNNVKVKYNNSTNTNKFITVPKNTQFKLVSNNAVYMIANQYRRYPVISEDSKKYYVLVGRKVTYVEKTKATVDKGIPVLMYHHLLYDKENKNYRTSSTMDVNLFEQQMKYLYDNKNITITPTDLELFLKGQKNLSTKAVLITFDDGNKSGLVYAEPILKKFKLKATNFIITSRVDDKPKDFNPNSLQFLSKDELVKASTVFNYGSHTHGLHKISTNNDKSMVVNSSYSELTEDLKKSKKYVPAKYFAYPFGQYNATTLKVLKNLDYRLAFTTKNGYVQKGNNPLELNRIAINNSITISKFKTIINY